MDGGFGAPFGGEAADVLVDGFVEAEEAADDAAVEQGAVGVGVGEVSGLQVFVAEFFKNGLGGGELGVGEGSEV